MKLIDLTSLWPYLCLLILFVAAYVVYSAQIPKRELYEDSNYGEFGLLTGLGALWLAVTVVGYTTESFLWISVALVVVGVPIAVVFRVLDRRSGLQDQSSG